MMNSIWFWIIILVTISISWLLVEMINAPMMDDDYGVKYKKKTNGSKDEEQYKKGFYNGKTDKWIKNK